MYYSIDPEREKKIPLGKNPYPIKMLDAHAIELDQIAIKRTRHYGSVWSRGDCIREAIAQYITREQQ